MTFGFGRYFRFAYTVLFRGGDIKRRLAPRRLAWFVFFYTVFPLLELMNLVCFLLDDLLFPRYREKEIREPVFIVGNPRSGTTFLHRLLAKDRNFTTMRLWEILLAPSITQRRLFGGLVSLDRWLGGPVHKLISVWQKRWRKENVMHRIALQAPEEDEYLLLHIWSTITVWFFAGLLGEIDDWVRFDTAIPEREKRRVMRFYRECLQRHQYARDGGGRYYLSKNPNFSPKIDTLLEWFSDARFIYLARNPLDVIPSYISLLDFEWQVFGRVVPESAGCAAVLDMAEHWYSYPLERLAQTPQERYIVIDFDDMVSNPERTVRRIYERFGLELSPAYAEILWQETIASRHYQSEHDYSLQETDLSQEQIVTRFGPVFERFGFDRRVSEDNETVVQVSSAKGLTEKAAQRRKRRRVARRLRFPV